MSKICCRSVPYMKYFLHIHYSCFEICCNIVCTFLGGLFKDRIASGMILFMDTQYDINFGCLNYPCGTYRKMDFEVDVLLCVGCDLKMLIIVCCVYSLNHSLPPAVSH